MNAPAEVPKETTEDFNLFIVQAATADRLVPRDNILALDRLEKPIQHLANELL